MDAEASRDDACDVSEALKAPFPYFGGKTKIADLVWSRLGDVRNYVEPFAGSCAVLLRRPKPGAIETVNDLNGFIVNFWRAVKADPIAVAKCADWPVVESQLHAVHRWLVRGEESQEFMKRIAADPDYYDAKRAGWWCQGACCWIGSGWCDTERNGADWNSRVQINKAHGNGVLIDPHMDEGMRGIVGSGNVKHIDQKRPMISRDGSEFGAGVNGDPRVQIVDLHSAGSNGGVHSVLSDTNRPQLADAFSRGRGVNGNDSASLCEERLRWLTAWMMRLADRLRPVRVCCGHWARVCDSPSTLTRLGITGVFLDPPYRQHIDGKKNRAKKIYANDDQDVGKLCDEVQEWCLKWQDEPDLRIALCGYEGEYPKLEHWECVEWKSNGGYGNQSGEVNENARRERVWFRNCLAPNQASLF